MPHLYPASTIEHTAEAYLPTVSVRSQLIYTTLLLSVVAAISVLPFVYVDVSVQSSGVIRPVTEKNEFKTLVAGTLAQVAVRENQPVVQGQVLMQLQTDALDGKLRLNQSQQAEKQVHVRDLFTMVSLPKSALLKATGLQSPLYRQQYSQFTFALSESITVQQRRKRELDIHRKLYEDKVIARQEFENKEFEYNTAHAAYLLLVEQQVSRWQADLTAAQVALTELQSQEKQWLTEKAWYTIKAPVSGTVQQFLGKSAGSIVQTGEVLGIISPDSTLIVECYVTPQDIGHVRPGMPVTFQIDAFDYNQWGTITGEVSEVSNDFVMVNEQPVFRVKCRLDRTFLALKNGYHRNLRKGMTVRARMVLTQRSLFQLLYDKADDWLNPQQAG